jgi:hypothetical protein
MKNPFGCFALLIVLGIGAFIGYRTLYPPRVGGVAFNQLPPQTQKERRAEAQKLVEQVENVARAAKRDEKKRFTVSATEEQLNTLLQDRLKTEKFPIRDLRVGLSPRTLTAQGTVNYQGFDVPATLDGALAARNGELVFDINSLKLSGFSAPAEWKQKAQQAIGDGLRKALGGGKGARIESVEVESGKITVSGQTR